MSKKTITTTPLVFGNKPVLTFTKSALPLILEALDKTTDKNGYVVNIKDKKYVLDYNGDKFKADELIGIAKKSFITNIFQYANIVSGDKKLLKQYKKSSDVLSWMYDQERRDIEALERSSKKYKRKK